MIEMFQTGLRIIPRGHGTSLVVAEFTPSDLPPRVADFDVIMMRSEINTHAIHVTKSGDESMVLIACTRKPAQTTECVKA